MGRDDSAVPTAGDTGVSAGGGRRPVAGGAGSGGAGTGLERTQRLARAPVPDPVDGAFDPDVADLVDVDGEEMEVPGRSPADLGVQGGAVAVAFVGVGDLDGVAVDLDVAFGPRRLGDQAVDHAAPVA